MCGCVGLRPGGVQDFMKAAVPTTTPPAGSQCLLSFSAWIFMIAPSSLSSVPVLFYQPCSCPPSNPWCVCVCIIYVCVLYMCMRCMCVVYVCAVYVYCVCVNNICRCIVYVCVVCMCFPMRFGSSLTVISSSRFSVPLSEDKSLAYRFQEYDTTLTSFISSK